MIIIIIFIIMVMMRIVCEWSNEDCMKVDEDKLDLSFGNFDPLASFGSPRNQQIITILLTLFDLFVYVLRLVCLQFFCVSVLNFVMFV
ncbi:unnamed protein product, partial [Brassica oleracea]